FTLRGGVAARLQRLPAAGIAPGGDLKPTLIAELRPPISVDNFEGVAVRAGEDGRVYVYIISDDNFNPLQRTLLMMFEMRE
ncbi:MAG: esterase-like activity of phytase family protein, partial [Rhodospirillaceae bacterium]